MRVIDIMSAPVHTIRTDESATAAWEAMRLHGTNHLVVTGEEGRVTGVVSAGDLGGAHGEVVRAQRCVRELMTDKLVVVHPDTTVREAANLMRGHAVGLLPVFDHRDRLKGVVTVVDLLELIGRGHERPTKAAPRAVLKNRGVVPRQATVRNRTNRAAR